MDAHISTSNQPEHAFSFPDLSIHLKHLLFSIQTSADFLVAVMDPYGRIAHSGFEACMPHTALELAEYFKLSDVARLDA
ncbi:hypothetical protein A0H81_06449 [Grifola frondosa]|uniref:Uncharacterized protein n=1 Tax=Grifola frondosa TaxID=5627 RepID=A0A1C7MAI0_GRIFR|nr:hypothetical protein A0H81_06449 [Grifola frondosa]